ncbi:hypothetical protein BWQ96_09791 [Gracilariopsis chorda]|uniref:BZIP domain-containing protein n=1 Tax=Gracilariopsis chorda TaxID=448386 RepID=A0A2V3IH92_9FLOR|nr:hypothetical protein BWQ96_09791 [Gracilariopsis chorda]|eukprot:PXF40510.1 hypothetical protein BWQ96_09791 [Gracilariopsis chorda]
MLPPKSSLSRGRERVAGLRLPQLPPRDLERLAATGAPHSAPANAGLPHSRASLSLPPPLITPTKFAAPDALPGNERSPTDVRTFSASTTPLMVRGLVSPTRASAQLVLPSLSLPHANDSLPLPPPPLLPPPPHPPYARHSAMVPVSAAAAASVANNLPRQSRTTPSSPVTSAQMTQNEIKKAQNRKSAKRFREAQKQRWKNMADDLLNQKRIIDDLRAQLAAQASTMAHVSGAAAAPAVCHGAAHHTHAASRAPGGGGGGARGGDRRAVSINELVNSADASDGGCASCAAAAAAAANSSHRQCEAEAAMYAQILSNVSQKGGEAHTKMPYAADLGVLMACYVVTGADARITAVRRGSAATYSTFATDGLCSADQRMLRNALRSNGVICVRFQRGGAPVNAVINPIAQSHTFIVAEFAPFQ